MTGITFSPSSGNLLYVDLGYVMMTTRGKVAEMPIMYSYNTKLLAVETGEQIPDGSSSCLNKDCGDHGICVEVENQQIVCVCSLGFSREDATRVDSKCTGNFVHFVFINLFTLLNLLMHIFCKS